MSSVASSLSEKVADDAVHQVYTQTFTNRQFVTGAWTKFGCLTQILCGLIKPAQVVKSKLPRQLLQQQRERPRQQNGRENPGSGVPENLEFDLAGSRNERRRTKIGRIGRIRRTGGGMFRSEPYECKNLICKSVKQVMDILNIVK